MLKCKADPDPWSAFGLVGVWSLKKCVDSRSAMGLLGVNSWGPLYPLKCEADLSFFLLPVRPPVVYSRFTCRYIKSFFRITVKSYPN